MNVIVLQVLICHITGDLDFFLPISNHQSILQKGSVYLILMQKNAD